jgi:hypothetical protein
MSATRRVVYLAKHPLQERDAIPDENFAQVRQREHAAIVDAYGTHDYSGRKVKTQQ